MSSHQEHGDKGTTNDAKHSTEKKDVEENANTNKVSPLREKLNKVGHYALLGLPPVISICALVASVFAINGSQAQLDQLSRTKAQVDTLNSSLLTIKSDLEMLKASTGRDKSMQEEERKKEDEKITKVIQNITPIQVKLKIIPNIEDQLRQVTSVSGVAPAVASSTNTTSTVAKAPEKEKKGPPEKQQNSQVKAMKEAIDKYNKNN